MLIFKSIIQKKFEINYIFMIIMFNNLMKKNIGITFYTKLFSFKNKTNNIKFVNKRKVKSPFSYIRMGINLKNLKIINK